MRSLGISDEDQLKKKAVGLGGWYPKWMDLYVTEVGVVLDKGRHQ